MIRIKYEVFGKVQGVFFRKYTKKEADKLGISGWVMNTDKGTVVGVAEGTKETISQFQSFLRETGSPKSRIDRCQCDKLDVEKSSFKSFEIRR